VEVRVSTRRKKTAGAHWEGDRIVVVVPAHLRGEARAAMVLHLTRRLQRKRPLLHASDLQLADRAAALADRHLDGIRPSSIRWSSNQTTRWGSCTPATREIRISERLRATPSWVLDSVIHHELVHLVEAGHGARFRELERRYPRTGDAELFLEGYALGLQRRGADRTAG
jgi:predicted metal-dependent hydrolase